MGVKSRVKVTDSVTSFITGGACRTAGGDISITYMHLMSTQYVFSVLNTFKEGFQVRELDACVQTEYNKQFLVVSQLPL